ncbi:MAG: DNA starvation/stationary phase protection protein [Acidobacteriota bacterium]
MSQQKPGESRIIKSLQQQLANSFLLYTNYKRYHWESYGPLFRDLHLLFDEHATAVLATIDELGERVRILGGNPIADPREFVEHGTVKISVAGKSMREMVEEATSNESLVVTEIREAVDIAAEAHDPGTADLFTRVVQIHEKHEWFLREILKSNDGLSK